MSSTSPIFIDNTGDAGSSTTYTEFTGNSENIDGKTDININVNPEKTAIYEQDYSDSLVLEITVYNSDRRKFVSTLDLYQLSEGNPFSESVLIYQNVQNGYGTVMAENKKYKYVLKP